MNAFCIKRIYDYTISGLKEASFTNKELGKFFEIMGVWETPNSIV
jgi:hypothetical protein